MKIKYILAISAFVFSLTACEKKLELLPEQDVAEEVIFSSPSTARSAVLGIYSTAQTLDFYGSLPQLIEEYMGDNVDFVGSFPTLNELRDFTTVSTNSNVATIWQVHYRVITRSNKVIAQIPNVPGLTDAEKSQYVGEAKFMRALAYLQLVNLFAQPFQVSGGTNLGVPLVLDDFTGEISFPARATVNEVHAQIEKDLTEAAAALPPSYPDNIDTRGRATKGAANALLSRLHLLREEWGDVITAARAALTGPYDLAPDYSFYSKDTEEDIFTIQNSATDNGRTGSGGWAAYFVQTEEGGRGDAPMSTNIIAAYESEPGDKRFDLKSEGTGTDQFQHFFTTKFPDAVNNSDDSPVIRTTEVYLNLAEALAQQSALPDGEAINILNRLRDRADLNPKLVFTSKQDLVDAILIERRKELAFEGFRRMDMLRYKKDLRAGNPLAEFGGDKTILPIPQREVDNNTSLDPNPGF